MPAGFVAKCFVHHIRAISALVTYNVFSGIFCEFQKKIRKFKRQVRYLLSFDLDLIG